MNATGNVANIGVKIGAAAIGITTAAVTMTALMKTSPIRQPHGFLLPDLNRAAARDAAVAAVTLGGAVVANRFLGFSAGHQLLYAGIAGAAIGSTMPLLGDGLIYCLLGGFSAPAFDFSQHGK